MARPVTLGTFQAMQRGEGEALGDREIGSQDVGTRDHLTGQVVDADPVQPKPEDREPTMAERLEALNVEAGCTAEMPRSLVVARIREASYGMRPAPTEADIQAEADRIWTSFGDNRKGPAAPDWRDVVKGRAEDALDVRVAGRAEKLAGELGRGLVADVAADGIVEGLRPAEMTPDRGPDVGTTVHQVTDGEPRFSGGGAEDAHASGLVPIDLDFRGKLYREAPELANIAEQLITRHGFLEDLRHCDIRWYWKRKTGVSKGRVKIGFMKRASDLLGHFSGADFIGWLSATTARDGKFTSEQVEAAVFHQLLHIGSDDKGNWIFLPHDFEGFGQEVRHYGTWTEGLKLGGQSFVAAHQMGLFEATDEDEDHDDDEEEDDSDPNEFQPYDEDHPADPDQPYDDENPNDAAYDTTPPFPLGSTVQVQIRGNRFRGTFLNFDPAGPLGGTCGVDILENAADHSVVCGMNWVALDQVLPADASPDREPDTTGELPTSAEIDAAMTDQDL